MDEASPSNNSVAQDQPTTLPPAETWPPTDIVKNVRLNNLLFAKFYLLAFDPAWTVPVRGIASPESWLGSVGVPGHRCHRKQEVQH